MLQNLLSKVVLSNLLTKAVFLYGHEIYLLAKVGLSNSQNF